MPNVDQLINDGITALKEGRKDDARRLLMQAVDADEHNETGWLYLSGCVETLEEQQVCLENVLSINPQNQKARKGLDTVKAQIAARPGGSGAAPGFSAPAGPPDTFGANVPSSFDTFGNAAPASPSASTINSPLGPGWGDFAASAPATSSSVDWGKGSAPAYGSGKDVQLPTAEEYDNWVSGLSLGGNAPGDTGFGSEYENALGSFDPSSGPFAAPKENFDDNPDPFGSGSRATPFGKGKPPAAAFTAPPSAPSVPASNPFGGFDDDGASEFVESPSSDMGGSSGFEPTFGGFSAPAEEPVAAADPFGGLDPFAAPASEHFDAPPQSGGFDDPDLYGGGFTSVSSGAKRDPFAEDPLFKSGTKKEKTGSAFVPASDESVDLAAVDAVLDGGSAFSFGSKSAPAGATSSKRSLYKNIPDDIQVKVSGNKKGGKTDSRLALTVVGLALLNAVSLAILVLNFIKR